MLHDWFKTNNKILDWNYILNEMVNKQKNGPKQKKKTVTTNTIKIKVDTKLVNNATTKQWLLNR